MLSAEWSRNKENTAGKVQAVGDVCAESETREIKLVSKLGVQTAEH